MYEFLREREENPIEMTQQEIKEELGLPIGSEGVGTCEQLLESAGVLERCPRRRTWPPCGWIATCRRWSICCPGRPRCGAGVAGH